VQVFNDQLNGADMFFTKIALVFCAASLLLALLADAWLYVVTMALGGSAFFLKPQAWIAMFLGGWITSFGLGWLCLKHFHLLPYR